MTKKQLVGIVKRLLETDVDLESRLPVMHVPWNDAKAMAKWLKP